MNYKKPSITVDAIILQDQTILLIKRKNEPFKNKWALPGGFVEYGETTEQAVLREIKEETGLLTQIEELVGVYSEPHRDPRGHTISIVYHLKKTNGELLAGDDAGDAKFFNLDTLPELSFDHKKIIDEFIKKVTQ